MEGNTQLFLFLPRIGYDKLFRSAVHISKTGPGGAGASCRHLITQDILLIDIDERLCIPSDSSPLWFTPTDTQT